MRLIGKNKIDEFKNKHRGSIKGLASQINSWIMMIESVNWKNHQELKIQFPKASILPNNNVIFNILGNRYRIWIKINYTESFVIIKAIGTHKEYDKWNITKNKLK